MWNYLLEKCEILDLLGVVGIPPKSPPVIVFGKFGSEAQHFPPSIHLMMVRGRFLKTLGKTWPDSISLFMSSVWSIQKKVFKVKKSWTRNFFLSVQREQDREIGREMKAYAASVQALDCIGFDPMFDLRTLLGLQHGKSSNSNDKYKLLISVSPFGIIINGSILVSGKSRLS